MSAFRIAAPSIGWIIAIGAIAVLLIVAGTKPRINTGGLEDD